MRDTRLPGRPRNTFFELALSIVALAGASPAGFAASVIEIDCNEEHPTLSRSITAADELDIRGIDLSAPTAASLDAIEALSSSPDEGSAAPHLYLGPRVATIVRDVFGDDLPSEQPFDPVDSPLGVGPAPVADRNHSDEPAISVDVDTDDAADPGAYSPLRIHREMYRTDI